MKYRLCIRRALSRAVLWEVDVYLPEHVTYKVQALYTGAQDVRILHIYIKEKGHNRDCRKKHSKQAQILVCITLCTCANTVLHEL